MEFSFCMLEKAEWEKKGILKIWLEYLEILCVAIILWKIFFIFITPLEQQWWRFLATSLHYKSIIITNLFEQVEVLKDGLIVSVLQDGDYFGDESLLGNAPRKHCVRAVTHVDMFCLRNVDLKHAFLSFPEEEERVRNKIL